MTIIPNAVTRRISRQFLVAKKNSPHIFFAAGLVGVASGTVLACRATLKLEDTLDEIKDEVEGVKKDLKEHDHYQKDLAYVYAKGIVNLGRLYGPAIAASGVGVALLTNSHIQLTKRNAALTMAYASLQKAYDDYRDRIREEIGEERERDIYQDISIEKSKDENNKAIDIKVPGDPNKYSPYARFFDEVSPNWEKDPELNRLFVQCQQNYANNLLQARGHLFLNEVYDMLGVDRSSAGQIVGWVIGPDGDNYVDFNMYGQQHNGFINGYERSILLDFNVDGVIYDKI